MAYGHPTSLNKIKSIMFKGLKPVAALLFYLGQGLINYGFGEDSIPPSYQWGRGINWPSANLNIGGYINGLYQRPEGMQDKLALDALSIFITWSPHQRVRFFTEVEADEWLSTDRIDTLNNAIQAERLYVDLLASESTTFRLGKFLTPIGHWNLIHAAPLIWTTTRPLVNLPETFSPHLNGLMVSRKFDLGEHNADVSLYADSSGDFDVFDNAFGFQNAFGGRIHFEIFDHLQLGASFINFQNESLSRLTRNNLYGVDLLWKNNGYEFELESIYRHASDNQGHEKGFYLQGVVPLVDDFYAVGRYEYLNGTHNFVATNTDVFVAALAWRPYVPLVIKAEYRFGEQNQFAAPSGFYSSIAMFF